MRQRNIKIACICMLSVAIATDRASSENQPRLMRTIQLDGLPDNRVPVITSVAIQPHGDLLATAGDDHVVRLWGINDGMLVKELRGHQDWVTAVSFCGDGSQLITGSRDRRVCIWDVGTGKMTGQLGTHERAISKIIVSDKADRVAIAAFRAPIKVYDLATRRLQGTLSCPCNDMRAVAFSQDLRFLAAGGRTGQIRVWDFAAGSKIDIKAHPRRVWSVVFTSDNRLISAGEDASIKTWDVHSGEQLHRLMGSSGKVLAMQIVGDDELAAAGADNVIRLFGLRSDRPHSVLRGHTGSVAALDYRNGTLISGSFDTTVRVWSLMTPQATAKQLRSTTVLTSSRQ